VVHDPLVASRRGAALGLERRQRSRSLVNGRSWRPGGACWWRRGRRPCTPPTGWGS
jgi:hypothetical protein